MPGLRGGSGLSGDIGEVGAQGIPDQGYPGDAGNPGPTCACLLENDVDDVGATGASNGNYLTYSNQKFRITIQVSIPLDEIDFSNIQTFSTSEEALSILGKFKLFRLTGEARIRLTPSVPSEPVTLFSDNFESGSGNWTLNSGGSGSNIWIVNSAYTSSFGNTPNQPTDQDITNAPNSQYLHIYPQPFAGTVDNALYNSIAISNRYAEMVSSVDTTSYSTVTLTFWYLCNGSSPGNAFGALEYNLGSGWVQQKTYNGVTSWTQESVSDPAWAGEATLRFRFRWANNNTGNDPAFAVDEVEIIGQ